MMILVPDLSINQTKVYGWLVGGFFLLTLLIEILVIIKKAVDHTLEKLRERREIEVAEEI